MPAIILFQPASETSTLYERKPTTMAIAEKVVPPVAVTALVVTFILLSGYYWRKYHSRKVREHEHPDTSNVSRDNTIGIQAQTGVVDNEDEVSINAEAQAAIELDTIVVSAQAEIQFRSTTTPYIS